MPVAARCRRWLLKTAASAASGVALVPRVVAADDGPDEPPPEAAPAQPARVVPELAPPAALGPLEVQTLALVNGARSGRGLAPLAWDEALSGVARAHAQEMMSRGVVSHTGSDGSSPQDRLRRAGIGFRFGSENIWTYWGSDPAKGPSTMHAAMMAESFAPGVWNHIGNILYTGYRRIGVGIAVNRAGVQYLSEVFAD